MTAVGEMLAKLRKPRPICNVSYRESIPASKFDGPTFKDFCSKWNKGIKSQMTVDITGQAKRPETRQKVNSPRKRAPPPNMDDLKRRYDIHLAFEPAKSGGECSTNCNDAFHEMALQCQSQGMFAVY